LKEAEIIEETKKQNNVMIAHSCLCPPGSSDEKFAMVLRHSNFLPSIYSNIGNSKQFCPTAEFGAYMHPTWRI
jgi:hypothetical protein